MLVLKNTDIGRQIGEPIHESVHLARRLAERTCRLDPETGESCAWYHGFRQYLRALDLAITPAHHAEFLCEAFANAVDPGQRVRVLISGAIDYSMQAHVQWVCRQVGATADVTVVDVCATPLLLNRWYSRKSGTPVQTALSSILQFEDRHGYDVICTNAFFGQFSPALRPQLMARWHNLLNPEGRVFTVTPFRPGSSPGPLGFTEGEARDLRKAVLQAAERQGKAFDLAPGQLAELTDRFTSRMRIHPVRSLEEIGDLFESAGFRIDHLSSAPPDLGCALPLTGPTVSRSAEYALVVASRGS